MYFRGRRSGGDPRGAAAPMRRSGVMCVSSVMSGGDSASSCQVLNTEPGDGEEPFEEHRRHPGGETNDYDHDMSGRDIPTRFGGLSPPQISGGRRPGRGAAAAPADADEITLKQAIAKLHTNLGHPSNTSLARAIRLTGGSDLAVSLALAHRCPVCYRLQQPGNAAHLPASLRKAREFGEVLSIDLFTLADHQGQSQTVLNAVDLATQFQAGDLFRPNIPRSRGHAC